MNSLTVFTLSGILISVRAVLLKHSTPIYCNPSGKLISFRFSHPLNAYHLISSILSGNITFSMTLLFLKHAMSTILIPSGTLNSFLFSELFNYSLTILAVNVYLG